MTTPRHATGSFDVQLSPGENVLPGTGRLDFTKTWAGDIEGEGQGVMLTGGNPEAGAAGYVAIERFDGSVEGRAGTFALQQIGAMIDGAQDLRYNVVPGSGTDALTGITGVVHLTITEDGAHEVTLDYALPD